MGSLVAQAQRLQPQSFHPKLVDHMHQPCTQLTFTSVVALVNPETSVSILKHHPCAGNLSTSGDSENAFLNCGEDFDFMQPLACAS